MEETSLQERNYNLNMRFSLVFHHLSQYFNDNYLESSQTLAKVATIEFHCKRIPLLCFGLGELLLKFKSWHYGPCAHIKSLYGGRLARGELHTGFGRWRPF